MGVRGARGSITARRCPSTARSGAVLHSLCESATALERSRLMGIRVLLADDHQIVRDGLKSMLAKSLDVADCPRPSGRGGVLVVIWPTSSLAAPGRGGKMNPCESTSSFGRRTESTTSTATGSRRRRSKRHALGTPWCSEPSPRAKTRFTTSWTDGRWPVSVLCGHSVSGWEGLSNHGSGNDGQGKTAIPITAREMTDKEKRRYRQWKNR